MRGSYKAAVRRVRGEEFDRDLELFDRLTQSRQPEELCECGCERSDHAFGGPCGCGKCESFVMKKAEEVVA